MRAAGRTPPRDRGGGCGGGGGGVESARMDTTFLKTRLDETIGRAVDAGEWPCALALVFDGEREFYEGFFGRADLAKQRAAEQTE